MFHNLLKLAIRHLIRHRSYVVINIFGLAVGLTCSILIGLFILHELSYDRFYSNADRIYRIYIDGKIGESELKVAYTSAPIGRTLASEIPDIIEAVRIASFGEVVMRYQDKSYIVDRFVQADSNFFRVFSIPLLMGDTEQVLNKPHTMVLTRSAAKRYFGTDNPVGKMIRVGTDTAYYTVTGVCEDVPENTHLEFDMMGSFITNLRAHEESWLNNSFNTYLLLAAGATKEGVEEKIIPILRKHLGPEVEQYMGITLDQFAQSGNRYNLYLQPLRDIHLDPSIQQDFKQPNDKRYLYIFAVIAILILVIAAINYMNLSTARSANRAHEVGMRKVLGSNRGMLIWQFLSESVIMGIIALVTAILLLELLLPYFNRLIRMNLSLAYFDSWYTMPLLVLLALVMGILSGSYPAFFLSTFRPTAVLSGILKRGMKSAVLRSILVVMQMTISIAIIFCTLVIFRQVHYMLNKDLGFDKENLMVIGKVHALGDRINTFIDEVKKIPGVVNASHSTSVPAHPNNNNGYLIEGKQNDQMILMNTTWTDMDHLDTYGMKLVEGRYFSKEFSTDSFACVINESAVGQFGLEKPVGTRFIAPGPSPEERIILTVIGVVRDFHFMSLKHAIYPSIFRNAGNGNNWGYITFRLLPERREKTVQMIDAKWKEFTENDPLQYFYLDEDFNRQYQEDRRTGSLSFVFAILAIIIASLGLFGLTSFTAEQRTREIGIRKVQGATIPGIVLMLARETSLLIFISTIIAWPAAWYFMKNWLENYSYRIQITPMEFFVSLVITLLIAWATIAWQSFRAARTNPAEALRYQ